MSSIKIPIVNIYYIIGEEDDSNYIASFLTKGSEFAEQFTPTEAACACIALYENFASLIKESEELDFEEEFLERFKELFAIKHENVEPVNPFPKEDE